jgi:hypothetical protein
MVERREGCAKTRKDEFGPKIDGQPLILVCITKADGHHKSRWADGQTISFVVAHCEIAISERITVRK